MFNQKTTDFCQKLNISLPVIQAPMAGGIISPTFVKAVNQHGGLGSLPLGYLSLEEARQNIRQTKALVSQPFAVNLFVPSSKISPAENQIAAMLTYINQCRLSMKLSPCSDFIPCTEPDVNDLVDLILEEKIAIVSLTFGLLNETAMKKLLKNHVFVIGTATTVQEGLALEASGCHAVIAQGYEAGGHRGGDFLEDSQGGYIGTMALVPSMVDALRVPVIASGGIMDGRGIAAALMLGASAVQLGTAFLTTRESNASALHKRMILRSQIDHTRITTVFTGKPVRSIKNEWMVKMEQRFREDELLPYPLQHQITRELRSRANKLNKPEWAGLWSGQGAPLSRSMSVKSFMATLEKEILLTLSQFQVEK